MFLRRVGGFVFPSVSSSSLFALIVLVVGFLARSMGVLFLLEPLLKPTGANVSLETLLPNTSRDDWYMPLFSEESFAGWACRASDTRIGTWEPDGSKAHPSPAGLLLEHLDCAPRPWNMGRRG